MSVKSFFFLPLLAASCLSCGGPGFPGHELLLVLPEAPEAWSGLPELEFELSWRGEEGRLEEAQAKPGERLRIRVARGSCQAILALPRSGASGLGRYLRPAGALYPEALEGGESSAGAELLRLGWAGGYAASVWRELERGGLDPAGYDINRLVASALEKGPDPWKLEPLEVAARLASSSFRIGLYTEGERFPVSLPGSPWAPESPFAAPPSVVPGAGPSSLAADSGTELGPGLWRFLGPSETLLVRVEEDGASTSCRK